MSSRKKARKQAIDQLPREVTVRSASKNIFLYDIKEYTVRFDKRELLDPWSCTCAHGSMYGVNDPEELCKHVQAVKKRMLEEGAFDWREQEDVTTTSE